VGEGGFTTNGSNAMAVSTSGALDAASLYGIPTGTVTVQATINGFGGGVLVDWNSVTQRGYALILTNATTLNLYKVVDGMLGSAVDTWTFSAVGSTNTLQLNINGGTLTPVLNGSTLLPSFVDGTPLAPGSVGIASTGGTTFSGFLANLKLVAVREYSLDLGLSWLKMRRSMPRQRWPLLPLCRSRPAPSSRPFPGRRADPAVLLFGASLSQESPCFSAGPSAAVRPKGRSNQSAPGRQDFTGRAWSSWRVGWRPRR
jgi:hypothetical protein